MERIIEHPILDIPNVDNIKFTFNNKEIIGQKGFTIAAALHQAGYPVHSHSLDNRKRSLECGIGKCGACEMLVDGVVKRICMTFVDGVKEVNCISETYIPTHEYQISNNEVKIYKTQVAIIGAGPAGLATREELNKYDIHNIVIDSNANIGGQFLMQTHKFFFFEKERKYGGLRGFDIAKTLAGNDYHNIFLNSTVWDILENNRLAIRNVQTDEIYYIDADYLVVATGAVPFLPTFENDDLPGVYTAAVVQKMMNQELTLLGKRILTVGAGNIGYLTSYQLKQAGANVIAIIEAMNHEGGFPVQANRVKRLGIPLFTSHILLKAIPNKNRDGIIGAEIAECENFLPIAGTEKVIDNIDVINICTGLMPDNSLLIKGREMFGRKCFGSGDAVRIGEGTSAVLRGLQVAYEILEDLKMAKHNQYLQISKEYIDSQQHPIKIIDKPYLPTIERMDKPFVILDCLYGFACNPCQFACKFGAITKTSSSDIPKINYDKCIGCMQCIVECPGLAIFGYNIKTNSVYLPLEFTIKEGENIALVDNNATYICNGIIEKVTSFKNKTSLVKVKTEASNSEELLKIKGFVNNKELLKPIEFKPIQKENGEVYICHCEDVDIKNVLNIVGERKFITVEEIKHTTHLGMGPCRGKRCISRLRQVLRTRGVDLVGDSTPRAPLSTQVLMGHLYNNTTKITEKLITPNLTIKEVDSLVAGGGIAGSALFRYLAEAGLKPILVNSEFGSSWRNIAAGRPVFSVPELSEIAIKNLELFEELDNYYGIDFAKISYISFAHDEQSEQALENSMKWQKAKMLRPHDFKSEISPYFNTNSTFNIYRAALKTENCWQATPGKTIDALRKIGICNKGIVHERTELIDVYKKNDKYYVTVKEGQNYTQYISTVFINAMGANGDKFAKKIGIETNLFPVKHQAFITRRLPMLGINAKPLDMLIDRRKYKGFSAVYGQQLQSTGQIIGCASPLTESIETGRDLRTNSQEFIHIITEIFVNWLPVLSSAGFQALWAGYYVEPRMIIDTDLGLFLGMKGQGFMLSQYLAKLYVDKLMGHNTPSYFNRLALKGDGLPETVFK